jgi:HAE1 family hydrophobic/amphiphilic exporter-1
VLFGPTFFVVIQRFENWRKARSGKKPSPQTLPEAPSVSR